MFCNKTSLWWAIVESELNSIDRVVIWILPPVSSVLESTEIRGREWKHQGEMEDLHLCISRIQGWCYLPGRSWCFVIAMQLSGGPTSKAAMLRKDIPSPQQMTHKTSLCKGLILWGAESPQLSDSAFYRVWTQLPPRPPKKHPPTHKAKNKNSKLVLVRLA